MKNQEIAKVFNDIADILEIKGDNPFRIRAYRRGAQNIDGFASDIAKLRRKSLKKFRALAMTWQKKLRNM